MYACYDQDTDQSRNIRAGCKVTSICNGIMQSIHVITSTHKEIFSISGDKRKGIEDYAFGHYVYCQNHKMKQIRLVLLSQTYSISNAKLI